MGLWLRQVKRCEEMEACKIASLSLRVKIMSRFGNISRMLF